MRPLALDLFCSAGGASMGLHRAGFDVIGVDIKPQPRYPFRFVQASALSPPFDLSKFDFIWASPPCQAHTAMRRMWNSKPHADLIPQTRALLTASGVPYVIENVMGAPLRNTFKLCGTMFNLATHCGAQLQRHRIFETNGWWCEDRPKCRHRQPVVGIYGDSVRDSVQNDRRRRVITVTGNTNQQNVVRNQVRKTYGVEAARVAMGIDWMIQAELAQAIPPAYSEFIGRAAIKAGRRKSA